MTANLVQEDAILCGDVVRATPALQLAGSHAERAAKGACEGLLRFKTTVESEIDETRFGLFDQLQRCARKASSTHIGHRAFAHYGGEEPRKMVGRKTSCCRDLTEVGRTVQSGINKGECLGEVVLLLHGAMVTKGKLFVLTDLALRPALLLDVRRGDGPKPCFNYTMASIAARASMPPDIAASVVRAIVKTQEALRADLTLATKAGKALFPPAEAALIAELVRCPITMRRSRASSWWE